MAWKVMSFSRAALTVTIRNKERKNTRVNLIKNYPSISLLDYSEDAIRVCVCDTFFYNLPEIPS